MEQPCRLLGVEMGLFRGCRCKASSTPRLLKIRLSA